jgi:hypothetical protein
MCPNMIRSSTAVTLEGGSLRRARFMVTAVAGSLAVETDPLSGRSSLTRVERRALGVEASRPGPPHSVELGDEEVTTSKGYRTNNAEAEQEGKRQDRELGYDRDGASATWQGADT